MTRKNLIFVVLAFIVGVSMWLFQVNRGMNETRELLLDQAERTANTLASQEQPPMAASPRSVPPPAASPSPSSAERIRLDSELQTLQQMLSAEQNILSSQQAVLERLRAQQIQQQQRTPAAYSSQIGETNTQIQMFMDQISAYQNLEDDITRRAADLLREQSSQAMLTQQQLDESIRAQENLIRQTQEQLAFWRLNFNYVNEQQARMQELQMQLEDQAQQLEFLRQQRLLAASDVVANSQALLAEKNQALSAISDDRNDMREEVARLREYIFSLQQAQAQGRSSQISLSSQINQMQKNLQSQAQTVRTLEAAIDQKNQELSSLQ